MKLDIKIVDNSENANKHLTEKENLVLKDLLIPFAFIMSLFSLRCIANSVIESIILGLLCFLFTAFYGKGSMDWVKQEAIK
jgi:hypothetical protein